MNTDEISMTGVREYGEGYPVTLGEHKGRPVVGAAIDAGFNSTSVDLLDLIAWLKANRPDLLS